MPFGLKNAAQALRRLMDTVCRLLDDILTVSSSHHEHHKHLQILFKKLLNHGLLINLEISKFERTHLDCFGHRIDKTGARPLSTKVDAIGNFPLFKSTKDLHSFICMINFYHRFIPFAAKLIAPLYRAIANNNKILHWSDSLQTSFTQAEQALANATLLHYPKSNTPIFQLQILKYFYCGTYPLEGLGQLFRFLGGGELVLGKFPRGKFRTENSPAVSSLKLMKIFLLYVIAQLFEIKLKSKKGYRFTVNINPEQKMRNISPLIFFLNPPLTSIKEYL